ncbi:MAG: gliding motility-associated C-terminal domain-containing protein, partial [Bacteroidales bacterium]|nr:gliding motility-associated C-terminal domain-containing protein [Bacteroidales bacterium]
VAPAAETKLYGADSVCVGKTEEYFTQYTKESTYFWNVTGDHLNYTKTDATSVRYVDWMKPGIDTLTVYEQTWAGCEGFDTLIVKIAPMPVPMFSWSMPGSTNVIELVDSTYQDSLWYTNSEGELVAEPVTYSLAWNYGHIGENEADIDLEVPYNQRNIAIREGDYVYGYNCPILTVTNSFGCKEKYTECIFVNLTSSLYVPNAFAPTNPAHSVRTFQPKGYNLKTCEISVYDKWGNLLWFSDEVEDGKFVGKWDGRYDGKMMKSDVYIWKMEATFLDGQIWEGFDNGNGKKTKFGSVTLVR